jgi:hypothetical protein
LKYSKAAHGRTSEAIFFQRTLISRTPDQYGHLEANLHCYIFAKRTSYLKKTMSVEKILKMVTYSSEYPRSMKYDIFYSRNLIVVSDHVASSHLSICKAWRVNIIRNSILLQWNQILFKQWPKRTPTYILTRGPEKDWKQSPLCV